MKKNLIAVLLLSGIMITYSCKENKKEPANQTTISQPATENNSGSGAATEPKTYVVTALPDTVLLGKNKEAFIRIKDLKATELSDPDGTSAGMEFTYKIELTNKNAIGGDALALATSDFRLELDNGNKIAPRSTSVNAQPEATTLSDDDKFTIPAGAKPTTLDLFYDQTRASVKLELK